LTLWCNDAIIYIEGKKKGEIKMKRKVLIAEIEKAIERENDRPNNRFNHTYSCSRWQKYGKDRLYINRSNGNREKGQGYFDLENMESYLDMAPGDQLYKDLTKIEEEL